MKPHALFVAMLALCGAGCSTTGGQDKQRMGYRVEPVESIRHGGPNAQSYYQLGRYFQGQHRLDQAEDAYLKAVAIDDRYVDAFNALASLYAQRGETERAVKMLEKLTAVVPTAAYLHNNLGYAYYLLGRQQDAYASVKQALALDVALERGWANLGLIAARDGGTALAEAVRTRALDALPLALGEQPASPDTESIRLVDKVPEAGFTVVTEPTLHQFVKEIQVAGAADVRIARNEMEKSSAESRHASDTLPAQSRNAGQVGEGRFVVVSTRQEFEAKGQSLAITMPSVVESRGEPLPAVRLEVSNGNGVSRFATRFSAVLRSNDIAVARITNHATFSMKQTIVEYQPGYGSAAQALMQRVNLSAQVVPANGSRFGADVRIVLGRDAVRSCPMECDGKNPVPHVVSSKPASTGA